MCMDRYINPFIDYGFKKLFATEANKDLLISFLNAIIDEKEDPVVDLYYKNVEQIGEFNGTRTNYFDVYCATQSGRQFIVEMQNSWKPFFKDRTVYYASKPIRDQGVLGIQKSEDQLRREWDANRTEVFLKEREGQREREFRQSGKPWNFRLNEVCLIAIMNFTFPKKEYGPESYFHKVMLSDIDDHHVFYDKLTLYYVEMPKLDNVKLELKTPRDKWLHALYHLWRYDDYPKDLDEDIFRKFYAQAEYANFTPAQQLEYERSRKFYLDTYNEIEGGRIMGREEGYQWGFEEGSEEGREKGLAEGHEKGLAEGHEKGLAEGAAQSKKDIARRMKELHLDKATILKSVGLTEEELERIETEA